MPTLAELQSAESQLVMNTYARYPLQLVRGEGVHVYDETGKQYLDMLSGHRRLRARLRTPGYHGGYQQAGRHAIAHQQPLLSTPGTTELALRLTEITGMDRVFLCNSGTEAWEAALKLARAHAGMLALTRKEDRHAAFIALENSFHGRTMGSVATTHKDAYRDAVRSLLCPTSHFVPHNDVGRPARGLQRQKSAASASRCCKARAASTSSPTSSSKKLGSLCDSTGALLLLDEIQSGMGRTGHWCAYQHTSVMPDITTLAKPLAGGIPMGAMLCTESCRASAFTPGMHGTTFRRKPLCLRRGYRRHRHHQARQPARPRHADIGDDSPRWAQPAAGTRYTRDQRK